MKKRRVSVALVLAIVLMLAAVTAVATVLLGGRDFVEDVLQPSAQQSDTTYWSAQEVEDLLRIARDNGLNLDEAQEARLLSGYDKEEMMRLFMKLELGKDPSTWSIEDQAWYAQMLVDIGQFEASYSTLPEAGEATEAQMLAAVEAHVHANYDPTAPITDPAVFRRHTTYQWVMDDDDPEQLHKEWYVELEALDLTRTGYRFALDTDAKILREFTEPAIISGEEPLLPGQLLARFQRIYGSLETWEMDAWVAFREQLQRSAAAHKGDMTEMLSQLLQSDFALPAQGAITKDAAIAAAQAGVGTATLQPGKAYAVYLMDGGIPVWKVTLPTREEGSYAVEIGALDSSVRNSQFVPYGEGGTARSFMLESVYEASARPAQAGTLQFTNKIYRTFTPLADGGYLVMGSVQRSDGNREGWIARVDAGGAVLWEVEDDTATAIQEAAVMSDGTYLVAKAPKTGEYFALSVQVMDANGRVISDPVRLAEQGWAYKGKDCLLIAEHKEGTGTRASTWFAVNAKGEKLWRHTYDDLIGAGFHPFVTEGGYILAGGAQAYPYDQSGNMWGFMGRLDDSGSLLWKRQMDDFPHTGISETLLTQDGGMYGAGMNYTKYNDDAEDYARLSDFVVRFGADGSVLWCHYYPDLELDGGISFFGLLPAPDGVLVLARRTAGDGWRLLRLNEDGVITAQQPLDIDQNTTLHKSFTAGGQNYIIYCSAPERFDGPSPINTYVIPVELP